MSRKKMTRSPFTSLKKIISAALWLLLSVTTLFCEEIIDNDFGYSLDLPEDFIEAEHSQDGFSYRFAHKFMAVSFVLKLHPDFMMKESFSSTEKILKSDLDKLNAQYETDTFIWENEECAISSFSFSFPDSQNKAEGWAIGARLSKKRATLTLLCYADKEKADSCQQFIVSCINSLCISEKSKFSPGIFTSYAYPAEQSKEKNLTLNINGKEIKTKVNKIDLEASIFVRDCEFAVFTLYANHEKWKEAWIRYYKAICRDSYSRMNNISKDILNAFFPSAERTNNSIWKNKLNETLLNWVQKLPYKRQTDKKSSDFTTPSQIINGEGCDCDGRSLLLCMILENCGIDCTLFISKEYSHSVYGAAVEQKGAKIQVNGTWYLLGETTANDIPPGLVSSQHRDSEKWIAVPIP